MDFEYFTKAMLCKVQLYLGNEYEASLREVTKNNGVTLTGIMAKKKGENAFPTFYLHDFYDSDMSDNDLEYVAVNIANYIKNARMSPNMNLDVFDDFEAARENIVPKIVNAQKNQELLPEVPHRRFHNLAIIYCYAVLDSVHGGQAAVTITNSIMNEWGTDEHTLFELAFNNFKKDNQTEIVPMQRVVGELNSINIPEEIPMYLISNKKRIWGAAALLDNDILDSLAQKLDSNYFILPSSIHEIIALKTEGEFASESQRLLELVKEVNHDMVDEQEFLADSVYYYDRAEGEVMWVC